MILTSTDTRDPAAELGQRGPETVRLVAAELAGASMGLGFLLTDSQNNGRVDRVLLAIVLLAVLGKITDTLIGVGEKRFLKRWS